MPAATHLTVRRTARYFKIGKADASDVWLVLHGYGQLADEFLEAFEPISSDRMIIAPEGLSRFYARDGSRVGASWMTREDREAEIADYTEYLNAVVADAGYKSSDVTVVGFSQGGHTACRWVAAQSAVAGLILWGSGLPTDLNVDGFTEALAGAGVRLVAGREDRFVAEADLKSGLELLHRQELDAMMVRFDGGHEIHAEVLRRISTGAAS
ncbi:MAG: phospholipase [Rhodothermales bacterium]|nr:phospholipase [Rhodothermales bacterium]